MNPYEIRLELLKLARGILADEKSIEMQSASETWQAQVAYIEKTGTWKVPDFPTVIPVTTDDVLKEAEKLNKFVSG
jgi:hypothetical protein